MSQPEPLTEQQLDEIDSRTGATRPGPWALSDDLEGDGYPGHLWVVRTPDSGPDEPDDQAVVISIGDRALGEFIAHAREDVPALLAEVRRLSAALTEMTHCRDNALRALYRDDVETDIDLEETIAAPFYGPGWDWDEADLKPVVREAADAVRPAFGKLTQERDRLRADAAAELLPGWEAVYEPGNVSDYLIGYMNDQDAATGAAEAWLRSQSEMTGRLEWVPWGDVTPMPDGYDRWFELGQQHDDGIDTGAGITVRRRKDLAPAPATAPLAAYQPSEAPVEGETATRASTGRVGDPPPAEDFTGTQPCGHDDYHPGHPWHERPDVWCPGIGYDDDQAATEETTR